MSTLPGSHQCTTCEVVKPLSEFHRDNKNKSGHSRQCKACAAAYLRAYYDANRERLREYNRKRYQRDKAKRDAKNAEWRKANPERMREIRQRAYKKWATKNVAYLDEYARQYREKNREYLNAHAREYYRKHPEKNHERRLRRLHAGGTFTTSDIKSLYRQQNGRCHWCGKALKGKYHIDHRVPVIKGGTNDPSNLVLAHAACNMSKSTKLPWEFNGRLL